MRLAFAILLALPLAGLTGLAGCNCGGDNTVGLDDGAIHDSGEDAGHPLGMMGAPCQSAGDCMTPLLCDPTAHTCGMVAHCTKNADCGKGALCTAGACMSNVPGGTCDTSAACVAGELCAGGHCIPSGCGSSVYMAERVPPNLLLVMDRSKSMDELIGSGASRDSKWNIARAGMHNLLTTYAGQIRFGLSTFPGQTMTCGRSAMCTAGAIDVPLGPTTETTISNFLNGSTTCSGGTPLAEELHSLVPYAGLGDTARANYILLITDGMPTCANPEPEVTALFRRMPPVKTFVVGFGSAVDRVQLAAMAVAGGTARSGTPKYYQADDAASLRAAFGAIAGSVLSCTYTLSDHPPDPSMLFVYFNGTLIPQNAQNGWVYNAGTNQLDFSGSSCASLQSGSVGQLLVVYGCPLPMGGTDAGVPPPVDGGPDRNGPCTACTQCGSGQGCVIPAGQSSGMCGTCSTDFECCLGFHCLNGQCAPGF